MRALASRSVIAFLFIAASIASGCGELRGRRKVRQGNMLYKEGRYEDAVRAYEEAADRVPGLPALWLNKGIACRHLILPGTKAHESEAAVDCAIDAFNKYRELRPSDPRGDQLYVQTLFDGGRFDTLAALYQARVTKDPADLEAVSGLVQVYASANRWEEALQWYRRKADLEPRDPESQYAVGVFLWQRLAQRGGGPDKASFDPRPDPDKPKEPKMPPLFAEGDIVGMDRIRLADLGIDYLEKALSLRPKYPEAMTYLNLLYRQKSFALFLQPDQWQACIDEATRWQQQAIEMQGGSGQRSGADNQNGREGKSP
jgi:tetratricopeptide (TPR) repeat protein